MSILRRSAIIVATLAGLSGALVDKFSIRNNAGGAYVPKPTNWFIRMPGFAPASGRKQRVRNGGPKHTSRVKSAKRARAKAKRRAL